MTETRASVPKPLFNTLFFALLSIYCIWVFTFPLFPTQDGAVHLYYTSVMHHLADHSELFARYFAVKWPPPPYILHYVLLYGLTGFVSPLTAEKLVVICCLLLFCLGGRFLLKSVTSEYAFLSLFILPLSLNWMVGMGFHNYCLSLGMSFFAIGYWLRSVESKSLRSRIIFLSLILLMLFTHPVPLMITLVVASGDLAIRAMRMWAGKKHTSVRDFAKTIRPELICLLLASSSLLYITLFVSKGRTSENLHHALIQKDMLLDFLKARPLVLVYGTLGAKLYRIWLFVLLLTATAMGVAGALHNLRRRAFTAANYFAIAGLAVLILFPIIPRSINGSDFFADRLAVYPWIFAVIGCSVQMRRWSRWLTPAAITATAVALGVVAMDNAPLKQISHTLALLEDRSIRDPGSRGMFIDNPVIPAAQTTFEPYVWSAARYFRVTNSVMMNSPWLDLPISPLSAKSDHFSNVIPPSINNYPYRVLEEMESSHDFQTKVRPRIDFVVLIGSINKLDVPGAHPIQQKWVKDWACRQDEWYSICQPPK